MTAYVTLEPCAHYGRTPPCCLALATAGIQRVVVALEDPFPEVRGRGIAMLRHAGIMVETGLLQDRAYATNIAFLNSISRRRPWVRLGLRIEGAPVSVSSAETPENRDMFRD